MSLTLTSAGSSGSPPSPAAARLKKISISGFRAFPPYKPTSFELDLGDTGKNLLLYGENGSGKTSLFRALRDLCDTSDKPRVYAEHQNLFLQSDDDAISLELTSGTPSEFRWEIDEQHPKETGGPAFQAFARSCLFLDYRDLLETNFVHRTGSPNLYRLLIHTILPDLPVPSRTLSDLHQDMLAAMPTRQGKKLVERARSAAAAFATALTNHLPEVVAEANRLLAKLQKGTLLHLRPPVNLDYSKVYRNFIGLEIELSVTYNGKLAPEPQHFLNEARLTATALALYLAAARITRSGRPGIMVLDDVLIGLDLSNRIPLLQLLKEDFTEWQILLLTHDATWFNMAAERLSKTEWAFHRLHTAREPGTGRERPLHVIESDYLIRAEGHLLSGDYPAAGVYLRSKFEALLRDFAEERHLTVPFKRELRELTSEDLWPGAKNWAVRQGTPPLISPALAREIEFCRRFILNPLCHEASGRPNRSEVELALAALKQLEATMRSLKSWRTSWDQRYARGQALPVHWHLALCQWMIAQTPALEIQELGVALREALAVGLDDYNSRHQALITYIADSYVTRRIQWEAAKAGGLLVAQPAFTAIIDANSSWLLNETPTDADWAPVTTTQTNAVFNALRGSTTGTTCNSMLHQW